MQSFRVDIVVKLEETVAKVLGRRMFGKIRDLRSADAGVGLHKNCRGQHERYQNNCAKGEEKENSAGRRLWPCSSHRGSPFTTHIRSDCTAPSSFWMPPSGDI